MYMRLRVRLTQSAEPATAYTIQLFQWLERTCYANDVANQGIVQILTAGTRGHQCRVRIYPARPLHPGFHKKRSSLLCKKKRRV